MRYRYLVLFSALAALMAAASVPMAGQVPRDADSSAAPTTPSTPVRTAWGDPDLRGVWRPLMQVPLERPKEFAGREFLTDAEIAARVRTAEERRAESEAGKVEGVGVRGLRFFNNIWSVNKGDPILVSRRTSAIIDPPNGRLPPWTPEQIKRFEAREAARRERGEGDSWEDRSAGERCINVVATATVPTLQFIDSDGTASIVGTGFNPVRRILQAPGYVAMVMEERGGYNIVPLNGRPALGPKIRQWLGDSRGHWDGNTLVVETTNINDKQSGGSILWSHEVAMHPGAGETLRVIERFTRVNADTLEYRYTVEDPEVYTRPFTVLRELTRDDDFFMDPSQCQENNESGMLGILAGARNDEQAALDFALEAADKRQQALDRLKAEWAEWNKSR